MISFFKPLCIYITVTNIFHSIYHFFFKIAELKKYNNVLCFKLVSYFYLKTLLRRLLVWWSAITDSLSYQEIACVFVTVWRYFMRIVSWFGSRVLRDGRAVSQTLTSVLAFPGQRATDDFRFSWRHRCQNRKRWWMGSHRTSATWSQPPLYNKDLFPLLPSYELVTKVQIIRYTSQEKKTQKRISLFFLVSVD